MILLRLSSFLWTACRLLKHCGAHRACENASLRLFDLRHGELPVDLIGIELHLVAGLDGFEHRGVLRLVDHGHTLIHSEPLGRAMLDDDLPAGLTTLTVAAGFPVEDLSERRAGSARASLTSYATEPGGFR